MLKETLNLRLQGSAGRPMLADIRWVKDSSPVIIFVHGFKGFKDWGPFPLACKQIAEAGFTVVSFNMSHNGTTADQPSDFADLEAFGQNNYTKELHDLGVVIDWVCGTEFPVVVDKSKLFLIGHSRGGGNVILKASEDKRVNGLVTWASVEAFGQWFDAHELEKWEKEGVIYTFNSRTNQNMPMYYQMREDFLANQKRLNIPEAATHIDIPWLIAHGSEDPTVPVSCAYYLNKLQPRSELLIIHNGDHTFGGKHPWMEKEMPEHLGEVVEETVNFFRKIESKNKSSRAVGGLQL
jgi:uncharacterized protein